MNVTLADVLAGASAHAVPLTAECAGYLVLAATDQAVLAPRRMPASELELCGDGSVRVGRSRACEEPESERDLRALLDELLLAASSVTPALMRTGRRAGNGSLPGLLREIETALIPVNRAAARRALARLQRETLRALESGRIRREMNAATASALAARMLSPSPRPATPLPAAASVAPTPAPVPVTPAPPSVRPPSVLIVPNDPVPPPTPRPRAKLAPEREVVLPSLTPPPAVAGTEVETRPEPVVLRASTRPPAAPRDPRPLTPLFGTSVAARAVASAPERHDTLPVAAPDRRDTVPAPPAERRDTVPVSAPDTSPLGLEAHELTSMDDDVELVYLDDAGDAGDVADLTEHCPPVTEAEVEPAVSGANGGDASALERIEAEAALAETLEPLPTPLVLTERLALPIVPTFPPVLGVVAEPEPLALGHVEPLRYAEREAAPFTFTNLEPSAIEEHEIVLEHDGSADLAPIAAEHEPEPPVVEDPEPSPIAELARLALAEAPIELPEPPVELEAELISEVEFAVLVDERSELPGYCAPRAPEIARTPPPRLALPKGRPSDVEELLGRLGDAPLAVDELRDGLQRLAGLELTPVPGARRSD